LLHRLRSGAIILWTGYGAGTAWPGWDALSLSGRLLRTMAGPMLALPSAGSGTADLQLMPHALAQEHQ